MSRPPLMDSFGRTHDRLRISVTDRCNLRCFYCMPAGPVAFQPRADLLTFEEIERVVRVLAGCGVRKLRLTGGEPLVRADLPSLASRLSRVPGIIDVGLTTNALLLDKVAVQLFEAGVSRLNVSLDALDERLFEEITRRPGLDKVLSGIEAARAAGFEHIKLNAVSVRGLTESQLIPFAEFARETGLEVRFIEYMPLDADAAWERDKVLFGQDILAALAAEYGELVAEPSRGPAPAQTYGFADGVGRIGLIPSVSEPFCAHCNRFRMTADGKLRACLFSLEETDVRDVLRGGGSDADLEAAARACIAGKWSGHRINLDDFEQPKRPMHAIGG